ncbi:MAG: MBL fold metallo-hydrolase [Candidatus Wildermuthbacteria bacterium]|nr:MBL fold metallo-hydrolase [Candidatus Wildermuthbacteria bacterium]
MQISWKGQACFQILAAPSKQEQVKIVIDPYEEAIGLKPPALEADILLITHDHLDHNNKKAIKGESFVIENPGEYEIKGVFVQGIASFHDESQGKERGVNTIYVLEVEGIKICHLGDFGQKELNPDQLDAIGDVDVLLIPVGGVYTIAAKEAASVVHQIEPKIAIPMHYALPKLRAKIEGVEEFLKVMGAKEVVPEEKLTLKARDLTGEETRVVVLQP